MTQDSVIKLLLAELRRKVEQFYGDRLKKVILYGSQARGDATAESNIDVMIVLGTMDSAGDEIIRLGDIKNQLNLKYDQLISIFPVTENDYLHKQTPLLINVRQEGVSL
jgi:predicted nucleotidyltransferase